MYHGLIIKKVDTQIKWANIRKEPKGKKGSAKASSKAKMLRIIYWVLKEHRPYQS